MANVRAGDAMAAMDEGKLRDVFDRFDADRSGSIDPVELRLYGRFAEGSWTAPGEAGDAVVPRLEVELEVLFRREEAVS